MADTETLMLTATRAVKNINIWRVRHIIAWILIPPALIFTAIKGLDVVVLRMPAAARNELVLLESFDILQWNDVRQFCNWVPFAGQNVSHLSHRVNVGSEIDSEGFAHS